MIDWNHDGKIDYKDEAFFHNVVLKGEEKDKEFEEETGITPYSHTTSSDSSSAKWFFIILAIYIFIKIIGG